MAAPKNIDGSVVERELRSVADERGVIPHGTASRLAKKLGCNRTNIIYYQNRLGFHTAHRGPEPRRVSPVAARQRLANLKIRLKQAKGADEKRRLREQIRWATERVQRADALQHA